MTLKITYEVDLQLRHAVLTPSAIEFYADGVKYFEAPLADDFNSKDAESYARYKLKAAEAIFTRLVERPGCLTTQQYLRRQGGEVPYQREIDAYRKATEPRKKRA